MYALFLCTIRTYILKHVYVLCNYKIKNLFHFKNMLFFLPVCNTFWAEPFSFGLGS